MHQVASIKTRLQRKDPLHGIWRLILSDQVTEMIALSGFDFQIFDREHGAYGFGTLESAVRLCELAGSSPWVRVTGVNGTEVQKCLDIGAHAIVFPQLKDYKDFECAVQCMKFPPLGSRGFNPFTRAGRYAGAKDVPAGLTDDFAMCVPIIETLTAVRDLDRILELGGIDLLYIGAYDLSVQLGCKGQMGHPQLMETMLSIFAKCRDRGVPTAAMVGSKEQIRSFAEAGVSVFVHTVDTSVVQSAFKEKARMF